MYSAQTVAVISNMEQALELNEKKKIKMMSKSVFRLLYFFFWSGLFNEINIVHIHSSQTVTHQVMNRK